MISFGEPRHDYVWNTQKGKTLKYLKKKPKWFDLRKYEGMHGLDAAGWLHQIHVRRMCASSLTFMHLDFPEEMRPHPYKTMMRVLASLRRRPICDDRSRLFLEPQYSPSPGSHDKPSIRHINARVLATIRKSKLAKERTNTSRLMAIAGICTFHQAPR